MELKSLIVTVQQQGGSEIHLKVGASPLMRHNKNLKRMPMPAVVSADLDSMVNGLLSADEQKKFQDQQSFEANYFGQEPCNFRVNLFKVQGQTQAIVRLLRSKIPRFEEIGFPASFADLTDGRSGLLILSGPARSGISTSLAAIVERMNTTRGGHILVLEDPIEYVFQSKGAFISQRQLKKDLNSVEQGINFAKRMDVDVLVIGDLKREPPMRILLEYVNGGHMVIISMQTLGIQNTLEKILISFPEKDRDHVCSILARHLLGICSQTLIFDPLGSRMTPIHELLTVNHTIRGILQKGRIGQIESNIEGAGEGSRLFESQLTRLVREGKVSKEISDAFLTSYRGYKV